MRIRTVVAVLAGISIGAAALTHAAETTKDSSVSLRWALGAIESNGTPPAAIVKDTRLKTGSRLKFLIEPLTTCSMYLVLVDSQDEVQILYRQATAKPSADAAAYVPPGTRWFQLDDRKGLETFFLLASATPLTGLDALLDKHAAATGDAKKKLGTDVVAELRRLQKEHRQFARAVEKPVMIGGRTRGAADDAALDHLATEVAAQGFYDKTITIEH